MHFIILFKNQVFALHHLVEPKSRSPAVRVFESSGEIVRERNQTAETDKNGMSQTISLFLCSVRWQTSSREVACSSSNVAVVN